jgi:hypothetical protein
MSNSIDLNSPPPGHKYDFKVGPEEAGIDQKVRLFKDVTLFVMAIAFVILLVCLCYGTLTSSATTPEEKKWAMSIISGAAGGIIGYLVRR